MPKLRPIWPGKCASTPTCGSSRPKTAQGDTSLIGSCIDGLEAPAPAVLGAAVLGDRLDAQRSELPYPRAPSTRPDSSSRSPDTRYLPMAQKRTLNEHCQTKLQGQELISSGARPRPDLAAALASTSLQQLVYELAGDRYLVVFGDGAPVLAGKGDIYAADDFRRFVGWIAKVDEDAKH